MTTINKEEIQKFSRLADEWWDVKGKFKPLHMFNPIRIEYILDKISNHFEIQFYFEDDHFFRIQNILVANQEGDSFLDATLSLGNEFLQKVTTGKEYKPNYSSDFPANLIKTELDWEGALLPKSKSLQGEISFPVNQLRDPYIFNDELTKNNYLLYSKAGE